MSAPTHSLALPREQAQELARLIDESRRSCLWYLRSDYVPATREEVLDVLDAIARNGDRQAFQRSMTLRRWLSPTSSARSAAS